MATTITDLSPEQLRRAATIKEEIQSLEQELQRILGSATNGFPAPAAKKRRMSAAGRAKIAAAAKARWAKQKAQSSAGSKSVKPKRVMSAAARAKIAAAARARWAKVRANKS